METIKLPEEEDQEPSEATGFWIGFFAAAVAFALVVLMLWITGSLHFTNKYHQEDPPYDQVGLIQQSDLTDETNYFVCLPDGGGVVAGCYKMNYRTVKRLVDREARRRRSTPGP